MPHAVNVAVTVLGLVVLGDVVSAEAAGNKWDYSGTTAVHRYEVAGETFEQVGRTGGFVCHHCVDCQPFQTYMQPIFAGMTKGLQECQKWCAQDTACKFISVWDGFYKRCVMTKECHQKDEDPYGKSQGNVMIYAKIDGAQVDPPVAPAVVSLHKTQSHSLQIQEQKRGHLKVGKHNATQENNHAEKRLRTSATTAFFVSDNGQRCLEGSPTYINAKVKQLEGSFLAKEFASAIASSGSCAENGFASGPYTSPCLKKAKEYTNAGQPLNPAFWDGGSSSYALRSHKSFCH